MLKLVSNFLLIILLSCLSSTRLFASVSSPQLEHSIINDHQLFLFGLVVILVLFFILIWIYFRNVQRNEIVKVNERHYRTLLESTAAIPWELDLSTWLFTYVGPQVEKVTSYKPEEWYQENFWKNHLHPVDKEPSLLFCAEATARHEDHEFEYRFIKKDTYIRS